MNTMKLTALLFLLPLHVLAIEPLDNYYTNDLLDAVDQAKASPHHYDYSNNYRYKRTTAQSIDLNRLNLKELDETRLKTNKKYEVTAELKLAKDQKNITDQSIKVNSPDSYNSDVNTPTTPLIQSSHYSSAYGEFNSSGIRSESIIKSTPRP